ncbi:MAG: PA2169 family four-helix-bundle protein [Pseudomonadota bacterium]|nr:PA2169 family four-helix-bundle protein [Pseudomonadota bacterium]
MTDTSHDISTLNGLIATTIDSVDGYRTSAQDVENPRFAELFTARASERSSVAEQLRAEVKKLGGNPEDDGTILAAAHRGFVNLKAAVTNRDDQAIVNEVERGEDHIKAKYEAALKDDNLSPQSRSLVETAYSSVKSGHDQMRDLKHNFDA